MDPRDEAEKVRWHGALVPEGASDRQAEVARLVHAGLENKEIAARLYTSVSTVKSDIQVLFGILAVTRRKRQVMGSAAWRVVDAALAARGSSVPPTAPVVPLPLPRPAIRGRKTHRAGPNGRRRATGDSEERPREPPRA